MSVARIGERVWRRCALTITMYRTRKLAQTVHFYENVLGFTNGPRPPFNFPGAWLYSSGHPVLHLNVVSGPVGAFCYFPATTLTVEA